MEGVRDGGLLVCNGQKAGSEKAQWLSVKVEVDVLGPPFPTVLMVSVSGWKATMNERWESVAGNFQSRVNSIEKGVHE